jgi:hypothetical protein
MVPLLKGGGSGSRKHTWIVRCSGSRRNMKPVELPKTLGVAATRDSPKHCLGATILDRTRINIKDVTATGISELSSGKQIHRKTGKMRN